MVALFKMLQLAYVSLNWLAEMSIREDVLLATSMAFCMLSGKNIEENLSGRD